MRQVRLRIFLRKQLGDATPAVGWGVLFPQATFAALDPAVDRELVYDDDDRAMPMHAYLDRLTEHWRKRDSGGAPEELDSELRTQVIDLLAPSFDLHATLRSRIRGVNEELVRLTREQSEFLDGFDEVRRLVVRGGAGTGKTMLALAESERLATVGHRVLLCCANGRLANHLAVSLANHERIDVSGAYELATSVVASAGAMDRVPSARSEDILQIHLPEIACEVLPDSRRGAYTALVLDEAQDLVSPRWLDLFGALLEGGLEQGCWRLFLDPNQDLILGSNPQSVDRLDDATESRYRLSKNCRNTREVATATAMLTGLETLDTLKVTGPAIEEHWYRSREQQRELAASILRDWIHDWAASLADHGPFASSARSERGHRSRRTRARRAPG